MDYYAEIDVPGGRKSKPHELHDKVAASAERGQSLLRRRRAINMLRRSIIVSDQ